MSQQLVERLAPRLKSLSEGAYERGYRTKGRTWKTSTHQLVAELLDSLGISYVSPAPVPGNPRLVADFKANGTLVFVDREVGAKDLSLLGRSKARIVMISREKERSDRLDHGVRVVGLGEGPRLQTIFLDDPSFNFDYAHILPKTQKCSVMHGHTSSALVEIVGRPVEGMVVDFADAKKAIRDAVGSLDHKLFINQKYLAAKDQRNVTLKFETVHGDFEIKAPKQTTVLLDGEATVENLAREVLARIAPAMPPNVTAVGVYVYEGMNKGSHVLAQLHSGGAKKRRKTR